jgi:hypothetical protein
MTGGKVRIPRRVWAVRDLKLISLNNLMIFESLVADGEPAKKVERFMNFKTIPAGLGVEGRQRT